MLPYRAIRHFVVTLDRGKILISQAREIVPNQVYEIIHLPDLVRCPYEEKKNEVVKGIGLGETTKIKCQME